MKDLFGIIEPKFRGAPESYPQAKARLRGKGCPLCGSHLLLPIMSEPAIVWKAHCNHCGSEVPIVVLLNRDAWRKTAKL